MSEGRLWKTMDNAGGENRQNLAPYIENHLYSSSLKLRSKALDTLCLFGNRDALEVAYERAANEELTKEERILALLAIKKNRHHDKARLQKLRQEISF